MNGSGNFRQSGGRLGPNLASSQHEQKRSNEHYMKGIPFASPEAVEFNDEAMEAIAYYAYEASSDLALERGTYSTYKGSKWDRGLLPLDTVDTPTRRSAGCRSRCRAGRAWTGRRCA